MELTVHIHVEDAGYWANVCELPGCFACGDSPAELAESLHEGIALYLDGATSCG